MQILDTISYVPWFRKQSPVTQRDFIDHLEYLGRRDRLIICAMLIVYVIKDAVYRPKVTGALGTGPRET